jgi:hypothetical protein
MPACDFESSLTCWDLNTLQALWIGPNLRTDNRRHVVVVTCEHACTIAWRCLIADFHVNTITSLHVFMITRYRGQFSKSTPTLSASRCGAVVALEGTMSSLSAFAARWRQVPSRPNRKPHAGWHARSANASLGGEQRNGARARGRGGASSSISLIGSHLKKLGA